MSKLIKYDLKKDQNNCKCLGVFFLGGGGVLLPNVLCESTFYL